ncbi:hypothetical protein [Mameliella sp.]|uniref:hypothetical protein n=1 Tax=Mameliella sp. TaxID=1924940 RepID=UPI003BAB695F
MAGAEARCDKSVLGVIFVREQPLLLTAQTGEGAHPRRSEPLGMRGTAATAGCALKEVAVCMGRGLRHRANFIERDAAQVPQIADEVHNKLKKTEEAGLTAAQRAKRAGKGGQ